MFKDATAAKSFLIALTVAWLIQFSLGVAAIGLSGTLIANFFYAIGGGGWAPLDQLVATFCRSAALYAPNVGLFTGCYALISLFAARPLAARYPANRNSAYALAGAVVPLAIGLITGAFNWPGAIAGALSLLPAAKILHGQYR